LGRKVSAGVNVSAFCTVATLVGTVGDVRTTIRTTNPNQITIATTIAARTSGIAFNGSG
jgi:hypothetical protein